jgi:hypothetical protein
MSKEQVELDYQKLLWERQDKIIKDRPKTLLGRLFYRGAHYEMPVMPLDDDYKPKKKGKS